ncbi:hypothetical protein NRF20_45595 [Streptomyces sp. R-74717]|uniref:hypothetical protein n=1 Tax=Streptomyces TaxID=1883 RepID=UPI00379E037B
MAGRSTTAASRGLAERGVDAPAGPFYALEHPAGSDPATKADCGSAWPPAVTTRTVDRLLEALADFLGTTPAVG